MKFVDLRAAGVPMYKISEEIGVHRTTLSMWHKELADYILIAKQDMMDELMYENNCCKMDRVEKLSRNLMEMYARLDSVPNKNDAELSKILDHIGKFTKLLQKETGEEGIERFFTNQKSKRINIKTKEVIDDEEAEPFDDEAPIWITNPDNFESYQPEEDSEEFYGTNKDNAIEVEESFADETYNPNTSLAEPRDISKEHPGIQEIFKRTFRRTYKAKKAAEEELKSESKEETNKDKFDKAEKETGKAKSDKNSSQSKNVK